MDLPDLEAAKGFVDLISSAIHSVYQPYQIKRLGKAQAENIKNLAPVIRENKDLPIEVKIDGLKMSSPEIKALAERTSKRIITQEMTRQVNMEKIADYAYDDIKEQESISIKGVSKDWINRFFNYAGDISEEDMQKLWGKLLADEVRNPSSYSIRTLEMLHNMSTEEARLFERSCALICCKNIIINNSALDKHGLPYKYILRLSECGLINLDGLASIKLPLPNRDKIIFDFSNYAIVSMPVPQNTNMHINVYTLTRAGSELYSVIGFKNVDQSYVEDVLKAFGHYREKCGFTIKEINRINRFNFYWGNVVSHQNHQMFESRK